MTTPDHNGSGEHGRGQGSVKDAAIWSAASQYTLFALQFVTSVIISRFFLQPEEIGLFSVALAAAMLFSVLQDFGISRYIGGHPSADDQTIRTCTIIAGGFALVIGALILAIAWPAALFYGEPRLFGILALIAASYAFVPFSIVPLALIGRRLEFRKSFIINVMGGITNSIAALVLAACGFSAESLAWAMVAQMIAKAAAAQWLRPTPPGWPPRLNHARKIISFGSGSSLLYLSGALGTRTPDLIIGRMLGMAATGLYSRGSALAAQFHMLVTGAVSAVYYPAFARLRDEGQDLGPYYQRVVAAHGAIVWPAMALLAVLAEPVILFLYGPLWVDAAPLLTWVALSELLFVALPLHVDIPILLGKLKQLIFRNFADTALSVGTLIAGAMIGLEEAAASRVLYGVLWFALYAFWMQRLVGFRWPVMWRIYLRSFLLALLTIAPAAWAMTMWRTPATLGFTGLALSAILAGIAWLIGMVVLRHPARADLQGLAVHALRPLLNRGALS